MPQIVIEIAQDLQSHEKRSLENHLIEAAQAWDPRIEAKVSKPLPMRSYEEIELAAGLVQQYADQKRAELDAEKLSIAGVKDYHVDGVVDGYANRVWRWKAAHYLAEALREIAVYRNLDQVIKGQFEHLREIQVYLHESSDAQRFWFDTEIDVAKTMWLLGYDWPKYSGLFHTPGYY